MSEFKSCPFCGEKQRIGIRVMPELFIDIYPDEEAERMAKAVHITGVCQCQNCFAQAEDWARLLVPYELYQKPSLKIQMSEGYRKFLAEAQDKAREMARRAWNRRA